jgi:hypothetical protein
LKDPIPSAGLDTAVAAVYQNISAHADKMVPMDDLSDYFPETPPRKRLHVIVELPSSDLPIIARGTKRKHEESDGMINEKKSLSKLWNTAPSSLAKPDAFRTAAEGTVLCNRPFTYDTIPIDLFQPEFGEFKKDCMMMPTAWAQELLRDLTVAACNWHDNETYRRSVTFEVLRDAGLYMAAETINRTEFKTDGNWKVNIMPPVIRECKNEYGCALFEAVAYYARFLKAPLSDHRHARFPCVLMVDVGMLIAVHLSIANKVC